MILQLLQFGTVASFAAASSVANAKLDFRYCVFFVKMEFRVTIITYDDAINKMYLNIVVQPTMGKLAINVL